MSERENADAVNRKYMLMNCLSQSGGVVFFGSTYFAQLPICELAKSFGLTEPVYNRSVPGLRIAEAPDYLQNCVLALQPDRIFIEIGEEDLKDPAFETEDFIARYEWLLYTVHRETKAAIYFAATFGVGADAVNARLKALAEETGCVFVDIADAYRNDPSDLQVVRRLRTYMRSGGMDLCDAMRLLCV